MSQEMIEPIASLDALVEKIIHLMLQKLEPISKSCWVPGKELVRLAR